MAISLAQPKPIFVYGVFSTGKTAAWALTGDTRNVADIVAWSQHAVLRGYTCHYVADCVEPTIRRRKNHPEAEVDGLLMEFPLRGMAARFDDVMRLGTLFRRLPVEVLCGGRLVKADTYIWIGRASRVMDREWLSVLFIRFELQRVVAVLNRIRDRRIAERQRRSLYPFRQRESVC